MRVIWKPLLQRLSYALTILLAVIPVALRAQPTATGENDESKVLQTISQALQDLEAGNLSAYRGRLTSDFYMFDGGKRFSADMLVAQLAQMRASGVRYHWSVTKPDIHIKGAAAWIAYVNDGSVTTVDGVQPRQWLESAFLVEDAGIWKVAFWHSTPIQASQPPKKER